MNHTATNPHRPLTVGEQFVAAAIRGDVAGALLIVQGQPAKDLLRLALTVKFDTRWNIDEALGWELVRAALREMEAKR